MARRNKERMNKALDSLLGKPEPDKQTDTQAHTQTKTLADSQTSTQAMQEPFADPVQRLLAPGRSRGRLEDTKRRQTYWLSPEEIDMVQQIADKTGATKYEVVGIAIQALYQRMMGEQ